MKLSMPRYAFGVHGGRKSVSQDLVNFLKGSVGRALGQPLSSLLLMPRPASQSPHVTG
jgi:hypothetical protein